MKLRALLFMLVLAALAPAGAGAASEHGVVIARQGGAVLVASPSGVVRAVHARAAIGARLNGARVVGRASRARIHGVVVERRGSTVFLSSNRHLLAVRSTTAPAPGTVVNATVGVKDDGELDEENEDAVGQVSGDVMVQATVTAVGPGTVTLTVNGQSVTLDLPAGLTLPASTVGQTVTIQVSLAEQHDAGDDDNGGDGDHHGGGDDGGGGDD